MPCPSMHIAPTVMDHIMPSIAVVQYTSFSTKSQQIDLNMAFFWVKCDKKHITRTSPTAATSVLVVVKAEFAARIPLGKEEVWGQ